MNALAAYQAAFGNTLNRQNQAAQTAYNPWTDQSDPLAFSAAKSQLAANDWSKAFLNGKPGHDALVKMAFGAKGDSGAAGGSGGTSDLLSSVMGGADKSSLLGGVMEGLGAAAAGGGAGLGGILSSL